MRTRTVNAEAFEWAENELRKAKARIRELEDALRDYAVGPTHAICNRCSRTVELECHEQPEVERDAVCVACGKVGHSFCDT